MADRSHGPHTAAPQTLGAGFERDSEKGLRLKGRLELKASGPWWFRTVTGATPDGRKTEPDNLVLDESFTRQRYSAEDGRVRPHLRQQRLQPRDPQDPRRHLEAAGAVAREVIVTPVSAQLGVPPVHAFPRLRRKDGSERRHAHVILVFGVFGERWGVRW